MKEYALRIDGRGDYATVDHTNDEWAGTSDPTKMMTVTARNHQSAMNKFVKMLGIEVRYRTGADVTDRNLHSFAVEALDDVIAAMPKVSQDE